MKQRSVTFIPKDGFFSVQLEAQHLDETVVVDAEGLKTEDPALIAVLDACEYLKRGEAAKSKKGGDS